MLNQYLRTTAFYSLKKSLWARPFSTLNQKIIQTEIDVGIGKIKVTNVSRSLYKGKSAEESLRIHNQLKQAHSMPNSLVCVCYPIFSKLTKEGKPFIWHPGHIYSFAIDQSGKVNFATHLDFIGNRSNLKGLYNAELGESSREVPADNIVKMQIKGGNFFTQQGRDIQDQKTFLIAEEGLDELQGEYAILTLPGMHHRERKEILANLNKIVPTDELEKNSVETIPNTYDYILTGGFSDSDKDIILYPQNCITVFCQMLGWKMPHPHSRFPYGIADHLFRASPQAGLIYAIEQLYGYEAAVNVFHVLAQNPSFKRGLSRATHYKDLLHHDNEAFSHEPL